MAIGDWDSAGDGALTPGDGRLFLIGFALGDSAGASDPFTIPGVQTVVDNGDFAGIDYLGAAVARYLDEAKPGIPAGTENGASAIIERSGTQVSGSGGTLTLDNFLPIRTLTRVGRALNLSPLPGTEHPSADVVISRLEQEVHTTYTACATDDSSRFQRYTLWTIYSAGALDGFELPLPPATWPRASAGGDLAGLVDPAATPEVDTLLWTAVTLYDGLSAGFDYDALRFDAVIRDLTHTSVNRVPY
jgi:hypothetical protein